MVGILPVRYLYRRITLRSKMTLIQLLNLVFAVAAVSADYGETTPLLRFLPRDAMLKRGTGHRPMSVCLSVCLYIYPSITFMYCIQTAKSIVKLFPGSRDPIILVFF